MRPILTALVLLSAASTSAQAPAPGEVVVNEVMYDPPAPQPSGNEWVEVVNRSDRTVNLQGVALADAASVSAPIAASVPLAPGAFAVLVRNADDFAAAYPSVAFVEVAGFPALNNTGDTVELRLGEAVLDGIAYTAAWGGADASLERRDPAGPSTQANFGTTTDPSGGTPGAANSLFAPDTTPPALDDAEAASATTVLVTFSEPVEAATAKTASNYVLDGGIGAPASAAQQANPAQVLLTLAVPLTNGATYTLTVSGVADAAGNAMGPETTTFFFGAGDVPQPLDLVVNEFLYDEPTGDNPGEYVELFNRSDKTFDLRDFTFNDNTGADEPITDEPVFVRPGEYAVIVEDGALFAAIFPEVAFVEPATWSALNNTGDAVVVKYQGAVVDSLTYTAAWGGTDVSLERRDPDGPSTQPNFASTTDARGGTPGGPNAPEPLDAVPPILDDAEAVDALTVLVTFDEPLDRVSAETASNYALDGGVGTPASATLQSDPTRVSLTLAAPLTNGATYTLTVSGVADAFGNVMEPASASFFFGVGEAAARGEIVVNEFLYDEPAAGNPGEYVELFNRSDKTFDLRQFTLNDNTGSDEPVTGAAVFLSPGAYAVVVEDGALFAAVFPDVPFVEQPSWSALNNTGDAIVLRYQGAAVDSLAYQTSWGGVDASLERKDPAGPSSVSVNWATTLDPRGGTPGAINSRFEPDVTGPQLVAASVSRDGRTVVVTLDEPVDPSSVTASAFAVVNGPAVTAATYAEAGPRVTLTLGTPLAAGTSTVTAAGLRDLLGNASATTSVAVEFVPDTVLPAIARASATSATMLRVVFTEPVTPASAGNVAAYSVDGGVGAPASVAVEAEDDGAGAAVLTFASALPERQVLTLTATGLRDLAGNVRPSATASVFVGAADVAEAGDIAITEIMYDPQNGSDGEYVEVLNLTADRTFDLRDLSLDGEDPLANEPALLLPGQFLALVRDADGFRAIFPDAPFVEVGTEVSLSNSGEAVVLTSGSVVIDSVAYDPDWHRVELDDATGIALERRDPLGPSNVASNWSSSLDTERGGTPSDENTVGVAGPPVARGGGVTVTSPFAPPDEKAVITVALTTEAALVRARVFDGGGRLVRELEPGRLVGSEAELEWDGTGDDRQRLRAGIYVVVVEAVDVQGGTTEAHRAAVVLARR